MATGANNKAVQADAGRHPDAIQAARDYGIDISTLMDKEALLQLEAIKRLKGEPR